MKKKITELKTGMNIRTKEPFVGKKILYNKYIINKVNPKTVDVTYIWHVDFGTERVERSPRTNKADLISQINYENEIVDIYQPE